MLRKGPAGASLGFLWGAGSAWKPLQGHTQPQVWLQSCAVPLLPATPQQGQRGCFVCSAVHGSRVFEGTQCCFLLVMHPAVGFHHQSFPAGVSCGWRLCSGTSRWGWDSHQTGQLCPNVPGPPLLRTAVLGVWGEQSSAALGTEFWISSA